jgi:hypothetical protein
MNNFFYDLNKRLSALADKQDAKQITEDARATAPKSKLAESMDVAEAGYSAKAGRAGKDLGKPGKNFAKIAKGAAERYGSKEAGERVAGAVLNKLRHPKEDIENEGNAFTGALAKTPKGGKFKVGGKEFKDTSSLEEGTCPTCSRKPCKCNEGNAFTAALAKTPKGGKFKVGGKEFTDTSDLEEGFEEMDAWLAKREKEKGTGKFDKKERTLPGGMKATTYTRKHDDEEDKDDEVKSDTPKKKGRPKSAKSKDQENVTKGSWKYKMVNGKRVKKEKTKEGLDSDGVMMTRSTNCSSEDIHDMEGSRDRDEAGEYGAEGDYVKNELHTMVRVARDLEKHLRDNEDLPTWCIGKLSQAKGMVVSVMDYIMSEKERGIEASTGEEGVTLERALSKDQAIAARIACGVQKGTAKAQPGSASAEMAKMAPKELKKFAKTPTKGLPKHVEEESTDKEDQKAERAGKRVAKDIEYDEGHKAKGDNKAEKAGKQVKKDIEYDDKQDKEQKVDETTVAGSVAPVANAAPKGKGGMQFGKGVYESYNKQFTTALNESISIESKMQECGDGNMEPGITITADGEEAAKLMMLLKLAGLESQIPKACPTCGGSPCGCDEMVDENAPDWPTNTETLAADPNLRTYSGGLNGPKSTGQTTVPVVASQLRRQASMEESVELERSLFKTWKNYKG